MSEVVRSALDGNPESDTLGAASAGGSSGMAGCHQHDTLARLSLVGALWKSDVTILGGCGHVGLPLGLALADSGLHVTLYDNNMAAVDQRAGRQDAPPGSREPRRYFVRTLADGNLTASVETSTVGESEYLIVVIGTPVDEHLNPDPQAVITALEEVADRARRWPDPDSS